MKVDRLQLDFQDVGMRRERLWATLALLVAVAFLAALVVREGAAQQQQLDALQSRNDMLLQRQQPAATPKVAPDADELRRIERANGVIDQLTVPWGELFRAIESADTRGSALLSMVPNARDRSLRLTGESRSLAELLAYVDRVAAQPVLSHVHLLGYDTVARDGTSVISFTLAAKWQRR